MCFPETERKVMSQTSHVTQWNGTGRTESGGIMGSGEAFWDCVLRYTLVNKVRSKVLLTKSLR